MRIQYRSLTHSSMERARIYRERKPIPLPALFLDRDGVIIEDNHYLKSPSKVKLIPGVEDFLGKVNKAGWPIIVITNQSGIARGYFNWDEYEQVTDKLMELLNLSSSLSLSAIYANGHGPETPSNSWRKPRPGMLHTAAKELNLDLRTSFLIGDRLSDLKAGANAGLTRMAHVFTGHGEKERLQVNQWAASHNTKVELLLIKSLIDFPVDYLG